MQSTAENHDLESVDVRRPRKKNQRFVRRLDIHEAVKRLIAFNKREGDHALEMLSVATTGAAAHTSGLLTDFGGSSSTFFGGYILYHPSCSASFVGHPMKALARETAVDIAIAARQRAEEDLRRYPSTQKIHINGFGLTAAIATDRSRKGADQMFAALSTISCVYTVELLFERNTWTRQEQDLLCQVCAINLMLAAIGLEQIPVYEEFFPGKCFSPEKRFSKDRKRFTLAPSQWHPHFADPIEIPSKPVALYRLNGRWKNSIGVGNGGTLCLIPTSGNPFTEAHRWMQKSIRDMGFDARFCIERQHPNKGPISDESLMSRLASFQGRASVLVTDGQRFYSDKAKANQNAAFAIGFDVAKMLLDLSIDYAQADLELFLALETKFYVFPRYTPDGRLETLDDLVVPERYRDLFKPVRSAPPPVSSTAIRQALGIE